MQSINNSILKFYINRNLTHESSRQTKDQEKDYRNHTLEDFLREDARKIQNRITLPGETPKVPISILSTFF